MDTRLDLRIRQLHEAIRQARTPDLSSIRPQISIVGNTHYVNIDTRNGASDAQLANIVSLFIANIACLKDHLKDWCSTNNKPFHGDALVNHNRAVGIIHDLWNRDKHSSLRQSRSGLFPELREVNRFVRLCTQAEAGSWVAMTVDPVTGELQTLGDGKSELVVDAEVFDNAGVRIGSLLNIADEAVTAWEATLVAAGIAVPPR